MWAEAGAEGAPEKSPPPPPPPLFQFSPPYCTLCLPHGLLMYVWYASFDIDRHSQAVKP